MRVPGVVKEGRLTYGQYTALHKWVKRQLGRPRLCVECGATTATIYDWANISGEYKKELADWKRLCRSCHRTMDFATRPCPRGHPYTPDNTYLRKDGRRDCITCSKQRSHHA